MKNIVLFIIIINLPSSKHAFGCSELGIRDPKSGHCKGRLLRGHRQFEQVHFWDAEVANLH
jgi:hypothetical protein